MKIEHEALSRKNRFQIMFYALLIGLLAGAISIVFHVVLSFSKNAVQGLIAYSRPLVLLLPFIVYGFLYFSERLFTPGNTAFGAQAVERELNDIDRQLMKPNGVILKVVNTIIALTSGFAVGQFGPTLHIGGAIGSNVGYYFKFSKSVIRALIGCGVAAAISAIMQTPLFATIFVIEVIFAKRYFDYMLPVLLSSLVAYLLNYNALGDNRIFDLSKIVQSVDVTEEYWISMVIFAVLMGLMAVVYIYALSYFEKALKPHKQKLSIYLMLASAFALLYYLFPLAHYSELADILDLIGRADGLMWLLFLLIARLLATALQLGSGVYGGNFSPGLTIGFIFGALINALLERFANMQMAVDYWLPLSAVAIFSGFAHAPISAVVLAVELTGSASLLVPALFVALISHMVCDLIVGESIYTLK
ncbi:MAG: hypothetical protein CSB19_01640 [Clostridiales bacterium]|nr:MAG: hypothetical protein CSB19_01640 [Clostridiales bacterium]